MGTRDVPVEVSRSPTFTLIEPPRPSHDSPATPVRTPLFIEMRLKFHWLSEDTYSLPLDIVNFQPNGTAEVDDTRRLMEFVNIPPGATQV